MATLARSLGPRALSLSAAVHAAAIGGLSLASMLGPESWPDPTAAASSQGGMVLDVAPLRAAFPQRRAQPVATSARRLTAAQPHPALAPTGPPARTIEPAYEPADLAPGADVAGTCIDGCVVGTGRPGGPGDPGPTDTLGGEGGPPEVVSVVPGGKIRAPLKVRDTPPVYPDLAIRTRLEGRVEIECRIDTRGRVVDATVVWGHPLLGPAALAAVRTWAYQPTLLNGVPVSVIMTVTVHFRIRG